MNKVKLLIIIIAVSSFNIAISSAYAQLNQNVIQYKESVNKDTLIKNINYLQAFGSRYAFNPNNRDIAVSLRDKLISYGWDAKLDSFYIENFIHPFTSGIVRNSWQYNVVADKIGIYSPDTVIVVGAHYDSYASKDTTYFNDSPGADDNATGVAAILEIARLYQLHNLQPIKTLRLELYASEELGLIGSDQAMRKAQNSNKHFASMICLDMIGCNLTQTDGNIRFVNYDNSDSLTAFCERAAQNYTTLTHERNSVYTRSSDSYSYYSWGKKAIFIHEGSDYPFYHTSNDIASAIDFDYFTQMTKLCFAITYLTSNTNDYYAVSIPEVNIAKQNNNINLKQNPSKEKIEFTYNSINQNKENVIITDHIGRIIINQPLSCFEKARNSFEISSEKLNTGLYILSIGNNSKAQKISFIR